jgi:hypothetical protein
MTITFYLHADFQKSEFARTAKPVPTYFTSEVELTPKQAKKMLDIEWSYSSIDINKGVAILDHFNNPFTYVKVHSLDGSEALKEVFSIYDNAKAEFKKQQEIKNAEFIKAVDNNRKKILGNKDAALQAFFYTNNLRDSRMDQETYDFIMSCIEEDKKEKEQNKIAEQQAKDKAKEDLKQWALKNGSELLKLRIEENMNWFQLANDEYFKSIMPDGFILIDTPDESWEIKNAELYQIIALREIKRIYTTAKLMRYKYDLQTDDDDDIYEHKYVITIELKSLSGEKKIFGKEI